jgi:hypothetical protein
MVESQFIAAAEAKVLCRLTDTDGQMRLVEPYMVYKSSRGKRLFHCYQVGGHSESGRPVGWKNPEVSSFVAAEVTAEQFHERPEYNPSNSKMFVDVYFALPKRLAAF